MRDERDVRGVAHYNPRKGEPPLRGLRNIVSHLYQVVICCEKYMEIVI